MGMAIAKAKQYGVGFVAVQNSTHYGIAGYYASMAIDAGCIGFNGTNARPSIAPTFGVEPCLGTNPLCFGVPTDEKFPFLVDCATSISQRGEHDALAIELFYLILVKHLTLLLLLQVRLRNMNALAFQLQKEWSLMWKVKKELIQHRS